MTVGDDKLDYRGFFEQSQAAADYLRIYDPDSSAVDKLVWEHQRVRLESLLTEAVQHRGATSGLDYACGGGRILATFPAGLTEVHGWDSSGPMLERCASAAPRARLLQVDLTESAPPGFEGHFDVITAFRLFLNLEPARREIVARRLGRLLKPGGTLILDNHGNRDSLRHFAVALSGRRHRFANEWSDTEVRTLLGQAEVQVVDRVGFGWIPDSLHRRRLTAAAARKVDTALLTRTRTPRLAIRVMYVARKEK